MSGERSVGIVLRRHLLSETSLIVHWFTREHGRLKTVAKGARQPKSAFAGKTDLFFRAELLWIPSRKTDLHQLKELSVEDFRLGVRRSYVTTLFASYVCELVEKATEWQQVDEEIFALLERALDYVGREKPTRHALRYFERELAKCLGLCEEGARDGRWQLLEMLAELPSMREELWEALEEKSPKIL